MTERDRLDAARDDYYAARTAAYDTYKAARVLPEDNK